MAKKEYQLKEKPASAAPAAAKTGALVALNDDKGGLSMSQFVSDSGTVAGLDAFEDLSLPPIIKTKGLKMGDVIFGKIQSFNEFHQSNPPIHSALITIHVLRGNHTTRQLEPVGLRASIPVGAVLARALGTAQGKSPGEQIADIKGAGWTEGTILAMQYQGQGKERGDTLNKAHLWNIKAQKPTGETLTTAKK